MFMFGNGAAPQMRHMFDGYAVVGPEEREAVAACGARGFDAKDLATGTEECPACVRLQSSRRRIEDDERAEFRFAMQAGL